MALIFNFNKKSLTPFHRVKFQNYPIISKKKGLVIQNGFYNLNKNTNFSPK
jgi:hypothetical protein